MRAGRVTRGRGLCLVRGFDRVEKERRLRTLGEERRALLGADLAPDRLPGIRIPIAVTDRMNEMAELLIDPREPSWMRPYGG